MEHAQPHPKPAYFQAPGLTSEHVLGFSLWKTAAVSCSAHAQVGEENGGGVGRWIGCSVADLHLIPGCMPTLQPCFFTDTTLGTYSSFNQETGFHFHQFLPLRGDGGFPTIHLLSVVQKSINISCLLMIFTHLLPNCSGFTLFCISLESFSTILYFLSVISTMCRGIMK